MQETTTAKFPAAPMWRLSAAPTLSSASQHRRHRPLRRCRGADSGGRGRRNGPGVMTRTGSTLLRTGMLTQTGAANRQYDAEMSQRRRRPSSGNNRSNSRSTPAPMLQLDRASEAEYENLRRARAPADASVIAPSKASFFVVACSRESGDQLCSTPRCCRPRRYWRISRETFSGEQDFCPSCKAPPAGTTVASGVHAHSVM